MLAEKCKFEFSHQKLENELLGNGTFQKIPNLKMMDFWQFQTGKSSVIAQFEKQKCQFWVKIACNFGRKIQMGMKSVHKNLTFKKKKPPLQN